MAGEVHSCSWNGQACFLFWNPDADRREANALDSRVPSVLCDISNSTLRTFRRTLLQSPVWDDPYVGTYRECGEKILVLTWWCFAVYARKNGNANDFVLLIRIPMRR